MSTRSDAEVIKDCKEKWGQLNTAKNNIALQMYKIEETLFATKYKMTLGEIAKMWKSLDFDDRVEFVMDVPGYWETVCNTANENDQSNREIEYDILERDWGEQFYISTTELFGPHCRNKQKTNITRTEMTAMRRTAEGREDPDTATPEGAKSMEVD